jgi:glycosyltransferase involved in cell wall biosynthesis
MLRQALASIRAHDADDLAIEILVGDNGSLAETKQIVEEFGGVHIPVAQPGASAARTAAMNAASGAYIAFLDDDDAWLPTHLRPQLALLDTRPELDAVVGKVMPAGQQLEPYGDAYPTSPPGEGDDMLREMLNGWFPQIGSFVGHMRVREWSGAFDPFLVGGQDLDWMLRTARRRALGFVDVPCVLFRSRAPGTYDSLQSRRIGYDRFVFFRHALPEWRLWKNPMQLMRAYSGTLRHFYTYFTEAAEDRAARGRKGDALKAILTAFSVFPLRGAYHLFRRTPMRRALANIFRPQPLPMKSQDPA